MAGEAEEVPAVVHELVHVHSGEHRGGALLDAHKIEQTNIKSPAKTAHGTISRTGIGTGRAGVPSTAFAIIELPGITRPAIGGCRIVRTKV